GVRTLFRCDSLRDVEWVVIVPPAFIRRVWMPPPALLRFGTDTAMRRRILGSAVRRVFARSATFFHQVHADNGVEDLASVTLEMDGGMVGSFCVGRIGAASHPSGGEIKLHILGTAGALVVSESRPEVGVYHRNQPPQQPPRGRAAGQD